MVVYATSDLLAGEYSATITVTAPGVDGSPGTIPVSLTITPHPFDHDGDSDIDLADFGRLQICLGQSGSPPQDPYCGRFSVDADVDVDQADLDAFQD